MSLYQSIQTNGTVSNGYASISSLSSYGTFGDFTIEFWLNKGAWNGAFSRLIDFNYLNGTAISRFSSTSQIYFLIKNGGFTSTSNIVDDTWTHIACVRSGSTGFIYINGTQDATSAVDGTTFAYTVSTNFGIGVNLSTDSGNERQTLKMTDIRLWKEARSQTQIANNMNTHMVGNETNLIGNWQFLNGSLADSTANANTMSLQANASIVTVNPY